MCRAMWEGAWSFIPPSQNLGVFTNPEASEPHWLGVLWRLYYLDIIDYWPLVIELNLQSLLSPQEG